MKESERIAVQLEHSLNGDARHGASLLELLHGVTPVQATAKPIKGWHSIWELVNHAIVWQDVARKRLEGESARFEIGGPEDWPPATRPATAATWRASIKRLRASTAKLAAAIRKVADAQLDKPVRKNMSARYQTLHGVVQHNLYHAGQIAAVKRAQGLPAIAPKKG